MAESGIDFRGRKEVTFFPHTNSKQIKNKTWKWDLVKKILRHLSVVSIKFCYSVCLLLIIYLVSAYIGMICPVEMCLLDRGLVRKKLSIELICE